MRRILLLIALAVSIPGGLKAVTLDPFEIALEKNLPSLSAPVAYDANVSRFSFETEREESLWAARDWNVSTELSAADGCEIQRAEGFCGELAFTGIRVSAGGSWSQKERQRRNAKTDFRLRARVESQAATIRRPGTARTSRSRSSQSQARRAQSKSSDEGPGGEPSSDPDPDPAGLVYCSPTTAFSTTLGDLLPPLTSAQAERRESGREPS